MVRVKKGKPVELLEVHQDCSITQEEVTIEERTLQASCNTFSIEQYS